MSDSLSRKVCNPARKVCSPNDKVCSPHAKSVEIQKQFKRYKPLTCGFVNDKTLELQTLAGELQTLAKGLQTLREGLQTLADGLQTLRGMQCMRWQLR